MICKTLCLSLKKAIYLFPPEITVAIKLQAGIKNKKFVLWCNIQNKNNYKIIPLI